MTADVWFRFAMANAWLIVTPALGAAAWACAALTNRAPHRPDAPTREETP